MIDSGDIPEEETTSGNLKGCEARSEADGRQTTEMCRCTVSRRADASVVADDGVEGVGNRLRSGEVVSLGSQSGNRHVMQCHMHICLWQHSRQEWTTKLSSFRFTKATLTSTRTPVELLNGELLSTLDSQLKILV